jgi:hypothetical protein
MHDYDCPCDTCRHDTPVQALFQRVLDVIERLETQLAPVRREHDAALDWLAVACGGPRAVLALDDAPLAGPVALPGHPRVTAVATLLDTIAREWFDAELAVALRRGLGRLWSIAPVVVTSPASATYVASGVTWAVGRANGVVGPGTGLTGPQLKQFLDSPSLPTTHARPVIAALRGPWPWEAAHASGATRLEPLGWPELLLGRTRAELIRVRDHALTAKAAVDVA